jgi:hypothetical protein
MTSALGYAQGKHESGQKFHFREQIARRQKKARKNKTHRTGKPGADALGEVVIGGRRSFQDAGLAEENA